MTKGAIIEASAPRLLPALTDANRALYTGGATGELVLWRCSSCSRWTLDPGAGCPACDGALTTAAASGAGTVFTFTINHHQFHPDVPPPTVIAIVQLAEQDDLRLPTNLVGIAPDAVRIGIPVHVLFERHGEIYYPVFEPSGADA